VYLDACSDWVRDFLPEVDEVNLGQAVLSCLSALGVRAPEYVSVGLYGEITGWALWQGSAVNAN
jgi:hypothetical protein